ncbi:MAG: phage tail sheath family protein [Acidobacteria bacterium]|nr:phage tail sheath family protein [Acidobacteriota bacterium]
MITRTVLVRHRDYFLPGTKPVLDVHNSNSRSNLLHMPRPSPGIAPQSPAKAVAVGKAPGVYINDPGPPNRTIPAAETATAAFVGPSLTGPAATASSALASFSDFQTVYGDASDIGFSSPPRRTTTNYLALAVKAFFENGGQKLYVSRVTSPNGTNAAPPTGADYVRALAALSSLRDVAVVAAPGGTIAAITGVSSVAPIHAALLDHVNQAAAYRFAVLDPPPGCSSSDVEDLRASIDSINAALYYPWIAVADPRAGAKKQSQINVPPSGFVCGIYARVDGQHGVFKAPANQPLTGAIALERTIANLESDALNTLGINCLRSFPGRGNLVWGARTISSDPDWKYVNVRRFLLYLEHSIDQGTQWAVFEPNNEQLWAAVRLSVGNFLHCEWQRGAMQGAKPEQAFFVKCDRTTMTQNDLDNGRLICEIGVAPLRPAEFIVFRIGQMTADAK